MRFIKNIDKNDLEIFILTLIFLSIFIFWKINSNNTTTLIDKNIKNPTFIEPLKKPDPEILNKLTPSEPNKLTFKYIEIIDGCSEHFGGSCVNVRSGPGTDYPSVTKLRTGIVLKISDIVNNGDKKWYKIKFDNNVRYPERISSDWYVADGDYIRLFEDDGDVSTPLDNQTNTKRIVVDLSEQTLYAYDGEDLFMKEKISTGLEDTPTPRGNFKIYKKTPSRYMQGPLPGISDQYYDLPGVPWTMYFTAEGGAIHGAYWHNNFGENWSHGCVNLPIEKAKELYNWADIGTKVLVQN